MFRFARIKVHPKLDLSGWYLVISNERIDLVMQMHKSAATSMFLKYHTDPHLYNQKTWLPINKQAEFYNPVKLSAGWLNTVLTGLTKFSTIYMNMAHGLLFGENIDILEYQNSDTLRFPHEANHKNDVKISISKWPNGEHYYLRANNNQVFSTPKFDSYDEAMGEARKYAFEANISNKT